MEIAWRSRLTLGTSRVEALARSGDVAGLMELAGNAGPRLRAAAASRLLEMDRGETGPAVAAALRHRSDSIRCVAIHLLRRWGDATGLAQAVFWLPPEGASRRLALVAIARLRQPKSAPVLAGSLVAGTAREGLREDEVELVLSLCRATANPAPLTWVIDVLTEAFEIEHEHIARRAENFLIWLGEEAVPAVSSLARSSAAPVRAVRALGQIGGGSVVGPLIEAVGHPDAQVREAACVALGELRDPVSVEALIEAVHDPDHGVRVASAAALERIGMAALVLRASAGPGQNLEAAKPHPRLARAPENGSSATRAVSAPTRPASLGAQ